MQFRKAALFLAIISCTIFPFLAHRIFYFFNQINLEMLSPRVIILLFLITIFIKFQIVQCQAEEAKGTMS